jgi:hypothetical protein
LRHRDGAKYIRRDKTSVFNREANTSKPSMRYMPAIFRFLCYNPLVGLLGPSFETPLRGVTSSVSTSNGAKRNA